MSMCHVMSTRCMRMLRHQSCLNGSLCAVFAPNQPTAPHARETVLLSGIAFLVVRCAVRTLDQALTAAVLEAPQILHGLAVLRIQEVSP